MGSDARFSLNGLTDDQIRFFLDGVPLELTGLPFGIANVPVNLITRAEIFRGVVPIRFGACDREFDGGQVGVDGVKMDGGTGPGPNQGQYFAVPTEVYGADLATSTSFVPIVSSLGVPEIALGQAREVDGRASIATVDKWLFIASSSAPVIERFEIGERGELMPAGRLNFMNYGVPEFFAIDDWGAVFISPTKAYIFNGNNGSHVIWNPTTMEITGEIAAPQGIVHEGYNLESVAAVRGNRMYRIFTALNYDTWDFLPSPQFLVVYDLDTDRIVSQVEESRCPQLYNRPFIDERGDIYFSGWVWTAAVALVRDYPKSCALRVRAGQDVFDPAYKLDFGAQITMGREAGMLRYLGNGKALLDVFHGERVTITPATDPKELANTANWRLWTVDLNSNTGAPLEGLDFKAGGYQDVKVDGRTFLMVPNEDYSLTTAYEVAHGEATPSFKIQGSSYNMARVR